MHWIEVAPPSGQASLVLAKCFGSDADRVGTFTGLVLEATDIQATYCLSENQNFSKDQLGTGQIKKGEVILPFFSQRTKRRRERLIHECVRSTTHLRAR